MQIGLPIFAWFFHIKILFVKAVNLKSEVIFRIDFSISLVFQLFVYFLKQLEQVLLWLRLHPTHYY